MQRRGGGDSGGSDGGIGESDDDEGFTMSGSGRMKGHLPSFLPPIARDSSVVSVLYQSNHGRSGVGGAIPSILGPHATDDGATPSDLRKRVIKELAKRERRATPKPELQPLPQSIEQRRKCEGHMAASMKLRLDNSSPSLSVARRQHALQQAQKECQARRVVKRSKGWRAEDFSRLPNEGGRRSCPPTIGVSLGTDGVPVSEEFVSRPWDDPAMLQRAAAIDAADRKARREQRQQREAAGVSSPPSTGSGPGDVGEPSSLRKRDLRAPVNDATLEAERVVAGNVYNFWRHHRD